MLGKLHRYPSHGPYDLGTMAGRPPSGEAPLFGRRLATLRKQRGLTQAQLADALGIKLSLVAYYERRAKNPTLEVATKIANFFDVSVGSLFGEDAPKKKPRAHPGPLSALEQRIELLRKLPRAQQEVVVKMLDGLLG
jgi:transcriptional regulator with XRE-family HTH domain